MKTAKTFSVRVVIEKAGNNYCSFSPDVLACFSVEDSFDEAYDNFKECLHMHIVGNLEDGIPVEKIVKMNKKFKVDKKIEVDKKLRKIFSFDFLVTPPELLTI